MDSEALQGPGWKDFIIRVSDTTIIGCAKFSVYIIHLHILLHLMDQQLLWDVE